MLRIFYANKTQSQFSVNALVHHALNICSKSKLKKINRIKEILLDNGYPEDFVLIQLSNKIMQFSRPKRFGPDKCPVYLHWQGGTDSRREHPNRCQKLLWIRGFRECICVQTNAARKLERCSTCHSKEFRQL